MSIDPVYAQESISTYNTISRFSFSVQNHLRIVHECGIDIPIDYDILLFIDA